MLILTIVGSSAWSFDRLIKAMDLIAAGSKHRVVCQTGFSHYRPQHCEWFAFKPYKQLIVHYAEADVIVAHASAGPRIYAVRYKKPVVIVPRDPGYGENIDGHQLEVAAAIEKENHPAQKVIYSENDVSAALDEIARLPRPLQAPETGLGRLLSALRIDIGLL